MTEEKEHSPNWMQYRNYFGTMPRGYPFNEGFPMNGHSNNISYELVTRDGTRIRANIDYGAERPQWKSKDGDPIEEKVVAAWCEL